MPKEIVKEKGLEQVGKSQELEAIVKEIIKLIRPKQLNTEQENKNYSVFLSEKQ